MHGYTLNGVMCSTELSLASTNVKRQLHENSDNWCPSQIYNSLMHLDQTSNMTLARARGKWIDLQMMTGQTIGKAAVD